MGEGRIQKPYSTMTPKKGVGGRQEAKGKGMGVALPSESSTIQKGETITTGKSQMQRKSNNHEKELGQTQSSHRPIARTRLSLLPLAPHRAGK